MLISLLLIAIATAGGFALSYVVDDDAPLMWRIVVGNIWEAQCLERRRSCWR
jgi:hypothetical protein